MRSNFRAVLVASIAVSTGCITLGFAGCQRAADPWHGTTKPRVLCSIAPLYCFAATIAGDDAEVRCLLTSRGPHEFQPSPEDTRLLATADLFISNGLGLEDFADRMVRAVGKRNLRTLRAAEQIPAAKIIASKGHFHGNVFHATGGDPHVWLGIEEAKIQVEAIRDELIAFDRKHEDGYRKRAADFLAELDKLKEHGKDLKNLPGGLISFHDSFRYFARSFGFEVAGVIRGTHAEEPSAGELQQKAQAFRQQGARFIAVEPQYPRGMAERLAEAIGGNIQIIELDPIETGPTGGDIDKDYYLKRMKQNIDNLKQVLK